MEETHPTRDVPRRDSTLRFTLVLSHAYETTDADVDHLIQLVEDHQEDLFTCFGVKRHDLQRVDIHFEATHTLDFVEAAHVVNETVNHMASVLNDRPCENPDERPNVKYLGVKPRGTRPAQPVESLRVEYGSGDRRRACEHSGLVHAP